MELWPCSHVVCDVAGAGQTPRYTHNQYGETKGTTLVTKTYKLKTKDQSLNHEKTLAIARFITVTRTSSVRSQEQAAPLASERI